MSENGFLERFITSNLDIFPIEGGQREGGDIDVVETPHVDSDLREGDPLGK